MQHDFSVVNNIIDNLVDNIIDNIVDNLVELGVDFFTGPTMICRITNLELHRRMAGKTKAHPSHEGASKPNNDGIDEIVARLEEDIVLGRVHPRERLIEDELCERFGVTRHALRLALAELDRMGLVERIPNKGALVRTYSSDDVEKLYGLRELLETAAAAEIPFPVGAAHIQALKEIQTRHDKAAEGEDLVGVFRANLEFHRKLFSLCGNTFLAGAIETYAQQTHGIRFFPLSDAAEREKGTKEHYLMIAALENADRQALIDLCREHLPASKLAYLSAYRR